MKDMYYEYEPYLGKFGQEIPCFRIYSDDIVLAQTNEELSEDLQKEVAVNFVKMFDMRDSLEQAIEIFELMPDFVTESGVKKSDLVDRLRRALSRSL